MAHTFFDTHGYIKRLVASGISPQQAEAQSIALGEIMHNQLASKADLKEWRAELCAGFNGRFARLDIDFARVRGEFALVKWMLGFLLAGMTATLLKIFQ